MPYGERGEATAGEGLAAVDAESLYTVDWTRFSNAAQTVEAAINSDAHKADLLGALRNSSIAGKYNTEGAPFFKKENILLPDVIREQFAATECTVFMGIFPEIHHAWITVDERIFLWNYRDGSDFVAWDGLDQVIVGVGLVRPKPNEFLDEVKYLLVLATPVEVVLLGVYFSGGDVETGYIELLPTQMSVPSDNVNMTKIVGMENGRIFMCGSDGCLYELQYQTSSAWYSSLFGRKCRKLNRSETVVSTMLPTFLRFSTRDPVRDLAVDEERGILYTLTDKNTIEVYDLGPSGEEAERVAAHNSILRAAQSAAPQVDTTVWNHPDHEILAVHSSARPRVLDIVHVRSLPTGDVLGYGGGRLGARELNTRLALFSHGCSVLLNGRGDEADCAICVAPFHSSAGGSASAMQRTAASAGGLGGAAPIHGAAPPAYRPLGDSGAVALEESVTALQMDCKAWAVCERSPPRPLGASSDWTAARIDTLSPSVELAVQHALPPREFLILSTQGVSVIMKQRPLDQIALLLRANDTRGLEMFFLRYGDEESAAMCLLLASQAYAQHHSATARPLFAGGAHLDQSGIGKDSESTTSRQDVSLIQQTRRTSGGPDPSPVRRVGAPALLTAPEIVQAATRAFFRLGQPPRLSSDASASHSNGLAAGGAATLGRPVFSPESRVLYSARHDGLRLVLSRVLALAWNVPVCVRDRRSGTLKLRLGVSEMAELAGMLSRLTGFIDQHPEFIADPGTAGGTDQEVAGTQERSSGAQIPGTGFVGADAGADGTDGSAVHLEQRSLRGMYELACRACECLQFLVVLVEHHFPRVMSRLSEKDQGMLVKMPLRDLVVTRDGFALSRALVTALMSQYNAQDGTADAVMQALQTRCASFFNDSEHQLYTAYTLMQKAKETANASERAVAMRECVNAYIAGALHLRVSRVCKELAALHEYGGVIEVALARAKALDPSDRVLSNAMEFADAQLRSIKDARMECYTCILEALTQLVPSARAGTESASSSVVAHTGTDASLGDARRKQLLDHALHLCEKSRDSLFHQQLYGWLVQCDLVAELLSMQTPYVEEYLKWNNHDLLWRLYVRQSRFGLAALTLADLAERTGDEAESVAGVQLTLDARVNFLSLALGNARSAGRGGPGRRSDASVVNSGADVISGDRVQEIEEKLDVARVQMKMRDELGELLRTGECTTAGASDALEVLNSALFTATELYNRFARPLHLWEGQLAILHCSQHEDERLIHTVWKHIISRQSLRAPSRELVKQYVADKLTQLGVVFADSPLYFPLPVLLQELEEVSYMSRDAADWDIRYAHGTLLRAGAPHARIFEAYRIVVLAPELVRADPSVRVHYFSAFGSFALDWVALVSSAPPEDSRIAEFQSCPVAAIVAECITALQGLAVQSAQTVAEKLHTLQSRIAIVLREL